MPAVERPIAGGVVLVEFNASSADATYQMNAGYTPGRSLRLRRVDSSSHVATATVSAGGVIDGVTNGTITVPPNSEITVDKLDGNVWETYGSGDLSGLYASLNPAPSTYTYNEDQTVATETVGGVTTTYTYDAEQRVATSTRAGVTRTYTYNDDGLIVSVA